jgi:hypothetical protein
MGATASSTAKSFNKTVNENIRNTLVQRVRNSQGTVTGTQRIKFKRINCENVNIGDISQKMVVTYNFSRIADTIDSDTLQADLKNAVNQAAQADSKVKAEFLAAPFASSASTTEVYNTNVNKVVSNYTHQDFTNDLNQMQAAQDAGFEEISGKNCDFGNISQDMYLDMVISSISNNVTEAFQKLQADNQATQDADAKSDTESKGIFSGLGGLLESAGTMVGNIFQGPILLILGIILFVVMIGMVIKLFSGGGGGTDPAMAAMMIKEYDEYEDEGYEDEEGELDFSVPSDTSTQLQEVESVNPDVGLEQKLIEKSVEVREEVREE